MRTNHKRRSIVRLMLGLALAHTPAFAQSQSWTRLADMPTARLMAGAAAMGGKFYVIGGCVVQDKGVTALSVVEAYDPATNIWQAKAPMPTARSSFGLAVAGGRIFVVGGTPSDTRSAINEVEAYDPVSDHWTAVAKMPTARSQVGAAAVGGKIYAVGGNAGHELVFEVYDPVTDRWATLPPLPTARRNAGVVAIDDRLFVVGGVTPDGWTPVATLDEYDPTASRWAVRPNAPIAKTDFAVTVQGGQIVVIGGFNRHALPSVEAYDPKSAKWTVRPPLPVPTQFPAAASLDGKIFVAGGTSKLPLATATLFVGDLDPMAAPMPSPAATGKHQEPSLK